MSYVSANFTITGVTIDASQSSTPVQVGSTANLIAKVTPAVAGITVSFTLDNGTSATFPIYTATTDITGTATATVTGLPIEVYKVTALIGTCVSSTAAYLAVYDPNGGFVTGGGWINSPAGAYRANTGLTGKANFGFNSKYKKGNNVPDGNTEFQFQAGNLNFSSSTYILGSLVISGSKATYKGVGTINGSGSYAFMVSAVDGDVSGGGGIDKFRIKIWNGNTVIYDNNFGADENDLPTTALGGGSIVIHKDGTKTEEVVDPTTIAKAPSKLAMEVYPNPSNGPVNFKFSVENTGRTVLEIYSVTGKRIVKLLDETIEAGDVRIVSFTYELPEGVYVYQLRNGNEVKTGKFIRSLK